MNLSKTKWTKAVICLFSAPQATCLLSCVPCHAVPHPVWMWCDAWPSSGWGSHRWFFPCHCPFASSKQRSMWGRQSGSLDMRMDKHATLDYIPSPHFIFLPNLCPPPCCTSSVLLISSVTFLWVWSWQLVVCAWLTLNYPVLIFSDIGQLTHLIHLPHNEECPWSSSCFLSC